MKGCDFKKWNPNRKIKLLYSFNLILPKAKFSEGHYDGDKFHSFDCRIKYKTKYILYLN